MRQDVLRMLVTGGPSVRGSGGMRTVTAINATGIGTRLPT